MKILFKSKESNIRDAAIRWFDELKCDGQITYSFTLPEYCKGFEPEKQVMGTVCAELEKLGHKYIVFTHYEYGIIIARKEKGEL